MYGGPSGVWIVGVLPALGTPWRPGLVFQGWGEDNNPVQVFPIKS